MKVFHVRLVLLAGYPNYEAYKNSQLVSYFLGEKNTIQ